MAEGESEMIQSLDRTQLPALLEARYESTAGFTAAIYSAKDQNLDLIAAEYIKELHGRIEKQNSDLFEMRKSRDTHKQNLYALLYGKKPQDLRGKQTWWGSIVEAKTNIAIGFGVAFAANMIVLPAFGYPVTVIDNLGITVVFTGISVVRQLVVRRFFNGLKWGHHK